MYVLKNSYCLSYLDFFSDVTCVLLIKMTILWFKVFNRGLGRDPMVKSLGWNLMVRVSGD